MPPSQVVFPRRCGFRRGRPQSGLAARRPGDDDHIGLAPASARSTPAGDRSCLPDAARVIVGGVARRRRARPVALCATSCAVASQKAGGSAILATGHRLLLWSLEAGVVWSTGRGVTPAAAAPVHHARQRLLATTPGRPDHRFGGEDFRRRREGLAQVHARACQRGVEDSASSSRSRRHQAVEVPTTPPQAERPLLGPRPPVAGLRRRPAPPAPTVSARARTSRRSDQEEDGPARRLAHARPDYPLGADGHRESSSDRPIPRASSSPPFAEGETYSSCQLPRLLSEYSPPSESQVAEPGHA